MEIVRQTPGVLADPPPTVQTTGFGDFSVNYTIRFYLSEYSRQFEIGDELMTRIWYAARYNLTIPYPIRTQIQTTPEQLSAGRERTNASKISETLQDLGVAEGTGFVRRLEESKLEMFRREMSVREGDELTGLHLIVSGRARMSMVDGAGGQQEIGHLTRGEFFGERALLSRQTNTMTVEAVEDLEILVLEGDLLHSVLAASPRAVRDIGSVIESRAV